MTYVKSVYILTFSKLIITFSIMKTIRLCVKMWNSLRNYFFVTGRILFFQINVCIHTEKFELKQKLKFLIIHRCDRCCFTKKNPSFLRIYSWTVFRVTMFLSDAKSKWFFPRFPSFFFRSRKSVLQKVLLAAAGEFLA